MGGSRSWCTPRHPSFVFVIGVVYTPTWDSSKSWCALGYSSFLSNPKGDGSRSWCTPGHPSFVFVVVYTPTWDTSKSCVPLDCPSFLSSLIGVVAGVGVPLATYLFCCCSCCCLYTYVGQWQKLVCPWLSIFSFKPKWGGSRSWCTPGHPSFVFVVVVVYTPTWLSILSFKPDWAWGW